MQVAPLDLAVARQAAQRLADGRAVTADEYNAIIANLAARSDALLGPYSNKHVIVVLPNNTVGYARIVGARNPNLDDLLLRDEDQRRISAEAALFIFDVASALRYSVRITTAPTGVISRDGAAIYGPFADKTIANRSVGVLTDPAEARAALNILSSSDSELFARRREYIDRAYGRSSVTKTLRLGAAMGGAFAITMTIAYVVARRKIDARKAQESVGISRVA